MNAKGDVVIDLVILDDHPIRSLGVSRLLNRLPDMKVAAVCLSATDALSVIRDLQPKVVVADLHDAMVSAAEFTRAVHAAAEGARVIIVTKNEVDATKFRASGVAGVISENAIARLPDGVRETSSGSPWVQYS
jgi:DNA-binding NarL/FixJ family response regulator